MPTIRTLDAFYKTDGSLVTSHALPEIPLETLQRLFNVSSPADMQADYKLKSNEQFDFFSDLLKIDLDPDRYDYFLSTSTTDDIDAEQ